MATPSPSDFAKWDEQKKGHHSHDSRVGLILAVEIPFITLVVLTVCLRFYARTFIKKTLGWDDWVMALSAVIALVNTVINCVTTRFGQGKHAWNFDYEDPREMNHVILEGSKLGWVYQVLFTPAVTLAKISIVMTYLRIFPSKRDRIFCFATLTYLILYGVIITFAIAFQCIPVNSYWDLSIMKKKCYNQNQGMIAFSALNTLSDLTVFLWPAPKLFQLQLPFRQRLGLIFVFSLGCVVCIAGIARMAYYPKFFASTDVFFEGALLSTVSNVECNVGIICGSLPEIRPLFMRMFKKRSGTTTASNHPSNPKSDRSPRNATFPHNQPGNADDVRREKSSDSFGRVTKWKSGSQDSHYIVNETVYLENLSPEKMRPRHEQRASGSEEESHGSEENWISGGEIHPHSKNIPGSAL